VSFITVPCVWGSTGDWRRPWARAARFAVYRGPSPSAGAVGAKKDQVSVAISLVVVWAIVMIFVLPLVARSLHLSTGVAGAWIGTSEFADAAGLAAAQTYGGYAGNVPGIAGNADAAVSAFTLMKVIGRDVWIGVWAFVLSLIATTRWERTGVQSKSDAGEIWRRFPKFVSAAAGAGTKTIDALQPVFCRASHTVSNTGTFSSNIWPPFPALRPRPHSCRSPCIAACETRQRCP